MAADDGLADPGTDHLITPNAPFFDPGERDLRGGSLYRRTELYASIQ